MTDTPLPQNVYRLAQKEFEIIPGRPWVYWVSNEIRNLFQKFPKLGDVSPSIHGTVTYDNFRYLRYWWESIYDGILFDCKSWEEFERSGKAFVPHMKGGSFRRWYGNQDYVIRLNYAGRELIEYLKEKKDAIRGQDQIFNVGITYPKVTSGGFSARISPGGFIFDDAGSSLFPKDLEFTLALLNSDLSNYILKLLNPTINFQVGNLAQIPVSSKRSKNIDELVASLVRIQKKELTTVETAFDYVIPATWNSANIFASTMLGWVRKLEIEVNEELYQIYQISNEDRREIESDFFGDVFSNDENEETEQISSNENDKDEISTVQIEISIRWISYAIGNILGRFQPGVVDSLGSAIYLRSDFAIGSLPAPDEAKFDELVGSADQFAYVDEQGGRHVFSAQVEKALQSLALPDGIAVFDAGVFGTPGHPRDLPTLVEKALNLMLGEAAAREVIQTGAGGDLRKFFEKDFFTNWHFKWYRKRPVYWPIQSSKRSYGFVIFHEKITHDTLYTIQREPYLDTKRNAVALKMADLQASLARATGTARKKLERELDDLRKLSDELAEFAKELDAITLGGYEPEPNWIDDGVILRMAPLWKVIPIWKSEPKKYWERLEAGDFDWSHIAMKYWPKRVREKCKTNKSYAIAHGHEEWFEGSR